MSLYLKDRHLAILGLVILAVIAARLILADTGTTPLNPGHPLSQTWIDTNLNLGSYNLYTLGNVGIGTTSPQERLDVAGAIRLSDTASPCDAAHGGTIKFSHGIYGPDILIACIQGVDGIYRWVALQTRGMSVSASDAVKHSHDAQATIPISSVYIKTKQMLFSGNLTGTYRISFEIYSSRGSNGYAKIYKNGAPVTGDTTNSNNDVWQISNFDFTNIASGDTIELWTRANGAGTYVRNFRVSYDFAPLDFSLVSTTNQ